MYVVTPFPNVLYAFDLTQSGKVKWSFKPNPAPASQGVACCDTVNRGAAYADGKIFYNTLDTHTVAVDAATGKEVWRTKLGDYNKGEAITMAPLVVKDKVLVGNSGGEFGARGWIAALDTKSGQIAWRAYSTGPDKDVLIGPNFHPFYESDRGKDLGMKTWPPEQWKIGGGTVGDSRPTTLTRTSSTTAPAILARGPPINGPVTTNGLPQSSLAGRRRAKPFGRIKSRRTISTITTPMRWSFWILRSRVRKGKCWSIPHVTGECT
jgi:hypothetical protein